MEKIIFSKYQGTGNDFVMIDYDRLPSNSLLLQPDHTKRVVKQFTQRKFGIGADGVIIVKNNDESDSFDFEMIYYNPDGSQSLCGNGSRCAVKYARELGIINHDVCQFKAYDGIHEAFIEKNNIHLKMNDVSEIQLIGHDYFIDTGSPHHIVWVDDIKNINVLDEGLAICKSAMYAPGGTNVNFVSVVGDNKLEIRTFERGVFGETFSCGTGVTASAIAASDQYQLGNHIILNTLGGQLEVKFEQISPKEFTDIFLIGPSEHVYEGCINL